MKRLLLAAVAAMSLAAPATAASIVTADRLLGEMIDGIGWSDQWSFWEHAYPGIMVTDTALFRYPHYHSASDTPDKLDYDRFALVVSGLEKTIENLGQTAK